MSSEILPFLIKIVVIFAFILLTTFGWTPLSKYNPASNPEEEESAKRAAEIVAFLSGDIGNRNYLSYENLERSAEYIIGLFKAMGYEVDFVSYELEGKEYQNIIATSTIFDPSRETIIIGAHYDSCFNPGADDNASGVAGLIELARLLKDEHLKVNLKFIAFVNEEPPFFQTQAMGSLVYARKMKEGAEKIKGAIILEMIGYYSDKPFSQKYLPLLGPFFPNVANFVAIVGNFPSKHLVKDVYNNFKKSERFPVARLVSPSFIPSINWSDHWSFWKVGIPAIMVTDTAYLRNKHYHAQTDLPNTLDYNKMAKVIHGLKHAIVSLE